jgi:hypothetical protein
MNKPTCSICGATPAINVDDGGTYCLCGSCVYEETEMRNYYQKRCEQLVEVVRLLSELLPDY